MSNLSPRALALSQAHGPGPVDWERVAAIVDPASQPIDRMKLEWWMCQVTLILNHIADAHGREFDRVAMIEAYNAAVSAAWATEPPTQEPCRG